MPHTMAKAFVKFFRDQWLLTGAGQLSQPPSMFWYGIPTSCTYQHASRLHPAMHFNESILSRSKQNMSR